MSAFGQKRTIAIFILNTDFAEQGLGLIIGR